MAQTSTQVPKTRFLGLLISTAAVLLSFGLVWLGWSQVAGRRLQARVDALVARHEPISPQDFATPPVPKAENAATYLNAAVAAMSRTVWPPSSSQLVYPRYPPFPAEWHNMAEQAVAADRKALDLARQARPFHRVDWGIPPGVYGSGNWFRSLASLLGDAALLAHMHNDDAEALECVRDALHEAEVLDDGEGGIVSHFIAIGIQSLALERLQAMAPDLRIARDGSAGPLADNSKAVPREVVVAMIRELLDDSGPRLCRRRAFLSNRSETYMYFTPIRASASVLRPMVDLEAARVLDDSTCLLQAVDEPTFASAEHVMSHRPLRALMQSNSPVHRANNDPSPGYAHVLSAAFSTTDGYVRSEWRSIAERRGAATDLAIQLYQRDHGAWPATLQALVPAYLSAVPLAPFGAADQPLGYAVVHGSPPGVAERPMLYFDVPDGRAPGAPPLEPVFESGNPGREWRDVSRWSPQILPGTQP
jgi:hypothetical protein